MKPEHACMLLVIVVLSSALTGCASRPRSVPAVYVRSAPGGQWSPGRGWQAGPWPAYVPAEDAWIFRTPKTDETGREGLKIAALGIVFFREGNYRRSEIYLRRALALVPAHQCMLTYHAACLARLGFVPAARAEFEYAIRLSPESEDAQQARKWLQKLSAD